jgi:MFS family permease
METITAVGGAEIVHPSVSNNLSVDTTALHRNLIRRIVPLLFGCYFFAYMDRVNVGFAKLQMMNALGFSDAIYGLGAGVFFIGYFLFEVPSNLILHNLAGPRWWIGRIMIGWGLLSASMLFVKTPLLFYISRFLLGASEAGFYPGILLYLTYWFPASRQGRVMALFATAVPAAGVIGGPLSGWLLGHVNGIGGLAGWQWLFLLEGLPSCLMGLLVLLRLDSRIEAATWLTDAERAQLIAEIAAEAPEKKGSSVAAAFKSKEVWMLAAVNFCVATGLYAISFWAPTMLQQTGVRDYVLLGLISAFPWLVTVVAMVWVGQSADQRGERRWHVAGPALVGAAGLALGVAFGHGPVAALFCLALATAGTFSAYPQLYRIPTKLLAGNAVATGLAIVGSVGNLAGFTAPYFMGLMRATTGSLTIALYVVAAIVAFAAVIVLSLKPALVNDTR